MFKETVCKDSLDRNRPLRVVMPFDRFGIQPADKSLNDVLKNCECICNRTENCNTISYDKKSQVCRLYNTDNLSGTVTYDSWCYRKN